MKRNFFTVIELLCVIGIITLLASLLVPAVGGAIEKSKVARAKSEISSIKTAVSSFYGQYGYFPYGISKSSGKVTDEGNFLKCLCNAGDTSNGEGNNREAIVKYNPRRIQFLEWSNTDQLDDPWGGDYQVIVDSDRDGEIRVSSDETVYSDVIVYSYGQEGSSAPESDWIKSWK